METFREYSVKQLTVPLLLFISALIVTNGATWTIRSWFNDGADVRKELRTIILRLDQATELARSNALAIELLQKQTEDRYTFSMRISEYQEEQIVLLREGRIEEAATRMDPRIIFPFMVVSSNGLEKKRGPD
jgi:predicted type IV restriction endonuclease